MAGWPGGGGQPASRRVQARLILRFNYFLN